MSKRRHDLGETEVDGGGDNIKLGNIQDIG